MQNIQAKHSLIAACALAASVSLGGCAAPVAKEPAHIERLSGDESGKPAVRIGVDDIIRMSQQGDSAEAIIDKLEKSRTHLPLNASQIGRLLGQDVAAKVVDHLLDTERRLTFEDFATGKAQYERACQERIEQEAKLCRLQMAPSPWPAYPYVNCWPPHAGAPYWRCF